MKLTNFERQNRMLEYILKKEEVSINELSEVFHVTTETIRKDVGLLEKKNLVVKKHGFVSCTAPYDEAPMRLKSEKNKEAKIKIAELAIEFIPPKSSIILDSSSTNMHLARLLLSKSGLSIFTNSMPIVDLLMPSDNHVFMLGGALRTESQSFTGVWTEQILKQISADIAFLSCNGFSKEGPKIHSYGELGVKSAMVKNSLKTILLADTSKFGQHGLYTFADYADIDMMICEREITEMELGSLSADLLVYTKD